MKRRSFLAALGLAPVATIAAKAGTITETPNEILAKTCADSDFDDINHMVTECTDWIGEETQKAIDDARMQILSTIDGAKCAWGQSMMAVSAEKFVIPTA